MYELERREAELALEEKRQLEAKRTLLQEAARKQDEPVDDSKLVEAMFDFLPDSSSEAPAPKDTCAFSDLPQQRADQQEVPTFSKTTHQILYCPAAYRTRLLIWIEILFLSSQTNTKRYLKRFLIDLFIRLYDVSTLF